MKLYVGRTSDGDYELGTSKKDFEGDYGFTEKALRKETYL